MTTMDLNNIGYTNDPFVLGTKVNQVFYVKHMSTKPKRGKQDEKNTNEPKRHIMLAAEDTPSLRNDHNQGHYVKKKFTTVLA